MDMMIEETFLASLEAEQSVIGAILQEPELFNDVFISSKHFYDSRNANMMELFKYMLDRNLPLDMLVISQTVGAEKMAKIGGITYLAEMASGVPSLSNFSFYQGIVLKSWEKRQVMKIGREMTDNIMSDDPEQVRQAAMNALNELEGSGNDDDDDGHISGVMVKTYDWMEQEHGDISGARSHFRDLDTMLGGFQRQDLVIVAARPSVGKTAFAVNIAQNYATHAEEGTGGPAGIFSLEMPDIGLGKRMISSEGNIDAMDMRNPSKNFSSDQWRKTTMAMGNLSRSPLHLFDKPAADIPYIRKKCRMMKRKYPGQHILIVIDYLQLIKGDPIHRGNRTQEIGDISRDLKQIARELDITVIALSQLNRGVEQRQDKRPMMSDIKESGQIEQDADVIAFLYREDYYDKETEDQNMIEIIIAKQRNGAIGTVKLAFIKEYNKFVTIDWSQYA